MPRAADRDNERRWIVVGEDGRYVTIGRASDPSEDEILRAEGQLAAQGLAGWLAIMQGNPYVGSAPRLMEVRALAGPKRLFAEAAADCVAKIMASRLPD